MPNSEKDRLAAEVEDRWVDFQDGLSNKRRYPVEQFRAFWEAGKRYAELTKNDPLIHRNVVVAINGLREFLEVERKRIPGTIIADADRLESLLFSGYDPYFEGDEPPGCKSGERPTVPAGTSLAAENRLRFATIRGGIFCHAIGTEAPRVHFGPSPGFRRATRGPYGNVSGGRN